LKVIKQGREKHLIEKYVNDIKTRFFNDLSDLHVEHATVIIESSIWSTGRPGGNIECGVISGTESSRNYLF
jgi:cysteinyl-tRNA synthetase